jgi:hypothetical protein
VRAIREQYEKERAEREEVNAQRMGHIEAEMQRRELDYTRQIATLRSQTATVQEALITNQNGQLTEAKVAEMAQNLLRHHQDLTDEMSQQYRNTVEELQQKIQAMQKIAESQENNTASRMHQQYLEELQTQLQAKEVQAQRALSQQRRDYEARIALERDEKTARELAEKTRLAEMERKHNAEMEALRVDQARNEQQYQLARKELMNEARANREEVQRLQQTLAQQAEAMDMLSQQINSEKNTRDAIIQQLHQSQLAHQETDEFARQQIDHYRNLYDGSMSSNEALQQSIVQLKNVTGMMEQESRAKSEAAARLYEEYAKSKFELINANHQQIDEMMNKTNEVIRTMAANSYGTNRYLRTAESNFENWHASEDAASVSQELAALSIALHQLERKDYATQINIQGARAMITQTKEMAERMLGHYQELASTMPDEAKTGENYERLVAAQQNYEQVQLTFQANERHIDEIADLLNENDAMRGKLILLHQREKDRYHQRAASSDAQLLETKTVPQLMARAEAPIDTLSQTEVVQQAIEYAGDDVPLYIKDKEPEEERVPEKKIAIASEEVSKKHTLEQTEEEKGTENFAKKRLAQKGLLSAYLLKADILRKEAMGKKGPMQKNPGGMRRGPVGVGTTGMNVSDDFVAMKGEWQTDMLLVSYHLEQLPESERQRLQEETKDMATTEQKYEHVRTYLASRSITSHFAATPEEDAVQARLARQAESEHLALELAYRQSGDGDSAFQGVF